MQSYLCSASSKAHAQPVEHMSVSTMPSSQNFTVRPPSMHSPCSVTEPHAPIGGAASGRGCAASTPEEGGCWRASACDQQFVSSEPSLHCRTPSQVCERGMQ